MRAIINISVPEETHRIIRAEMKKHHFATKSEFFRHILRDWMGAKLADEFAQEDKDIRSGKDKIKKLTNIKDLWR